MDRSGPLINLFGMSEEGRITRLFTTEHLVFRRIKILAEVQSLSAPPCFHVTDRQNEGEEDQEKRGKRGDQSELPETNENEPTKGGALGRGARSGRRAGPTQRAGGDRAGAGAEREEPSGRSGPRWGLGAGRGRSGGRTAGGAEGGARGGPRAEQGGAGGPARLVVAPGGSGQWAAGMLERRRRPGRSLAGDGAAAMMLVCFQ